ncbi:MAG: hypothetical protein ACFFCQ_13550, partial [Promethearchaeota archaeon]
MLSVLSENTTKHLIPIVDAHTHIGKEEVRDAKGITYRRNTLRDLIDFAEKLKFEIIKRMNKEPEFFRYQIPDDPANVAIPTYSLKQKITQLIKPKFNFGWLVDSSWVFPFNDVLKDKTIPRFVKVNDRTLSQILTPEKAIRFFPFARVDPHDGGKATDEVERAFQRGARGLKLHPISQHFVERICSPEVIGIVTNAAELGLPVIF